jgi:glycosyltransferase involved in cell wall biosynthesis
MPSTRHEGVPQIGLQALACRTPVVGSDVGGIPEIIRDGETGRIFPANDAPRLTAKIQEALSQPEQTRHMSERGRVLVEAEYSFDAMLNKLDAIYRQYLSRE